MTPDDERQEAEALWKHAQERLADARRRMMLPPWIWSLSLEEVGQCRLCGRTKLATLRGDEVCYHCDINPERPPKLRDVR